MSSVVRAGMYEVRDSAGVFLQHVQTGDFLFHLRDDTPGIADRGMWSLIGGSIDDGESPEQAAKREVREEIGIALDGLRYLGTIDAVDIVEGVRHPLRIALYLARIEADVRDIALTEGQEVRFFSLDAIMERDLKPEFKRFIFMRREDLER
jgi:8-oxo-dGTP diphosphatase